MSTNTGNIQVQNVAYLVYIAGVYAPTINVSMSYGMMGFPVASITVAADSTMTKFGEEDRVPVVVFFLDSWFSKESPEHGITPTWRLLYEGDITQWTFSKSLGGRSITFQTIHHISVLNSMSMIYLNAKGKSFMQNKSQANVGASQSVSTNPEMQVLSFFRKGAYGRGLINRPMDFINNLLVGMKIGGAPKEGIHEEITEIDTSLEDASSSKTSSKDYESVRIAAFSAVSAASEFFIKYNRRNKIDKRWVATALEKLNIMTSGPQNLTPNQNEGFRAIIKSLTFKGMSTNFSQRMSPSDSFWNLISTFYQTVAHHIVVIPTAPLVNVDDQSIPTRAGGSPRLANCLSLPEIGYALPPACNVVTPAMAQGFDFMEDYAVQNTRTIVNGVNLNPATRFGNGNRNHLYKSAMDYGYPSDQNTVLQDADKTQKSSENLLIYPEEFFKGPVVTRPVAPSYFLHLKTSSMYTANEINEVEDAQVKDLLNGNTPTDSVTKDTILSSDVSLKSAGDELLYSFAKSYYLEHKYSARGGAVPMVFNPYIVPGLPMVYIDNDPHAPFSFKGLVTSVSITLSPSGCSTHVSYANGRTLKEVYEQVFTENTFGPEKATADRYKEDENDTIVDIYTTAPIMPVRTLADTLQVDEAAEAFYRNLLYTGDNAGEHIRPAVFRHDQYFKSTSGDALASSDYVKKNTDSVSKLVGKTFPGTITGLTSDLGAFNMEVTVNDAATTGANIEDYENSMRRAARPICSIDEYMQFMNSTSEYNLLIKSMELDTEFGVAFPTEIRKYVVPKGVGDNYIRPYAKTTEDAAALTFEMRKDWPKKVREYRKKMKDRSFL